MRPFQQSAEPIEYPRRTPGGAANHAGASPRPSPRRAPRAGAHRQEAEPGTSGRDDGQRASRVWALVRRAQAGDREAFGALYELYVDTVYRFTLLRVGNRQLAEDLTADTFLRAMRGIGNLTWQGRDLAAWLITIARNLIADHYKSARHRSEVGTDEIESYDRAPSGVEGLPESVAVERMRSEALFAALGRLKPEHRECLTLRFLQGFSVSETARVMGRNDAAVKALQYRAVRALARQLPEGIFP